MLTAQHGGKKEGYSSVWLNGRHRVSVLHLSDPLKCVKSHLESHVGGARWSNLRQVDGEMSRWQIHGGRWLARQQRTRRPIKWERGRIITSTPVRGVTSPLMHWSETSSHVKRWVGEMEGQDRREKLDCREQLMKGMFLSFYEPTVFAQSWEGSIISRFNDKV